MTATVRITNTSGHTTDFVVYDSEKVWRGTVHDVPAGAARDFTESIHPSASGGVSYIVEGTIGGESASEDTNNVNITVVAPTASSAGEPTASTSEAGTTTSVESGTTIPPEDTTSVVATSNTEAGASSSTVAVAEAASQETERSPTTLIIVIVVVAAVVAIAVVVTTGVVIVKKR